MKSMENTSFCLSGVTNGDGAANPPMPCNPQVQPFFSINAVHAFMVVFHVQYAAHMVKTQPKSPAFLEFFANDFVHLGFRCISCVSW